MTNCNQKSVTLPVSAIGRWIARVLLVGAVATSAQAQDTYRIDSTHTFPHFEVQHMQFSIQRGRFNRTTGTLVLDEAKKTGSIEVTIDPASVDTGLELLEKILRGPNFFHVERYPTIEFRADELVFEGDRVVAAPGRLSMTGITQPVRLTVEKFRCGRHPLLFKPMCGGEVTATIKRSDFGMDYAVTSVGDEVRIRIPVEAFRE